MTLPALSPAARLVLLAIDETATVPSVAAILVCEVVTAPNRAQARAASVIEHLASHGALTTDDDETWTVTPRGERFRDALLRELADEGKRPAKASDTSKPSPSRPKPGRRARAPKAATTEASTSGRIRFRSAAGMVVCLQTFRQEKARGDK